jgi:hypothetical protein
MANDANTLSWIIVAILSFALYHTHGTVKEYEALNSHTLGRMEFVESNLLAAKRKIVDINIPTKEIDDALVDVRAEISDLRKYLAKK